MHIKWEPTFHFDPKHPLDALAPHGIPVPAYGNYGGPTYTAGVEGGTTPETPDPPPSDALDAFFYAHDLVHQHFQDHVITDPALIVAADLDLIKGMAALTYTDPGDPNYDPEAGLYEGLAVFAIVGKLAASGALPTLGVPDQLAIAAAIEEAFVNFEAGLRGAPAEAKSLHGLFHILEHQFFDAVLG